MYHIDSGEVREYNANSKRFETAGDPNMNALSIDRRDRHHGTQEDSPIYRTSTLGILILLCLYVFPTQPQAAVFPQYFLSKKPEAVSSSDEQKYSETDVIRIRTLLKEARAEFNKIDAPGGLSTGAPPGTPQYDLVRRRFLLRLIASNYDRLLSELKRRENLRSKLAGLDKNVLAGITGAEKPPYSILLVERVQERVQGAQFKVKQAEIELESTAAKKIKIADSLKKLEGQERALLETIEKESNSAKAATIEWNKLIVDLNRTFFSTELAVLQLMQKNGEEELAMARKELSYLGDTLNEVSRDSRFSESDLNDIKKGLEDRRYMYERELEKSLTENESLQNMAERRLSGLTTPNASRHRESADTQQNSGSRNEQLKNMLMQENLENSNLKVELLREMLELNRLELVIWELRYAAEVLKDTKSASGLTRMIPQALAYLDKQEELASLNLTMLIQKLNELESELLQPGTEKNHNDLKRLVSVYTSREELLLSRIKVMTAVKSVFTRLSGHYSKITKNAISKARLSNWKNAFAEIWNYELFATEDVYTVDGKEIKGKRGVTVGKVASALALLVFGLIVSAKGTKVLIHYAVKRYNMPEGDALLARRWLMALIFVVLLFTSLNLVHIPLTAFAFLGGAIALGTGFGIQDLMKNLMSGLMLLAERPFRITDYIEVDGVRGRVTSIGIRSSTIRDVTGIETLVPNSTFVEKNVTNWTYSSHQVRYSITVGVAYGSDIAVVKEQLLQAARSNHDVLKDPDPLVMLDDFGADALVFGLYYWIGLNSPVDPRVISSDLRTLIEKYLSEEGVTIAFPQRDIHIENLKPLQVEVIASDQENRQDLAKRT